MRGNIIRKIFVALIIFVPVLTYSDCKKQAKCGCGKDVLFSLTGIPSYIYFTDGSTISAMTVGDMYSTYIFCNPSQMFPKLANSKSGDILQLTGQCYWDCNYVYQSSNSSYQSIYRTYDIQVSDVYVDLYGKSKPGNDAHLNSSTPKN